jgi:ribosomal protein L29
VVVVVVQQTQLKAQMVVQAVVQAVTIRQVKQELAV